MTKQKQLPFEEAFARLEEILDQMNSSKLSLDESLTLYEEANSLVLNCQTMLKQAEKKVEILIKNRDQQLQLDENGDVQREDFQPENEKAAP